MPAGDQPADVSTGSAHGSGEQRLVSWVRDGMVYLRLSYSNAVLNVRYSTGGRLALTVNLGVFEI